MAQPLKLHTPANKTKAGVPVWIATDGTLYQGIQPEFRVDQYGGVRKTSRGVPFRRVYASDS